MSLKPISLALAVMALAATPTVAAPPATTMTGTAGVVYLGTNSSTASIDIGSVLTTNFALVNLLTGNFTGTSIGQVVTVSAFTATNGTSFTITSGFGNYSGTVSNVLSTGPASSRTLTAYALGTFTPAGSFGSYLPGPASVDFTFIQNGSGAPISSALVISSPAAPAPAIPEPSAWAMLIAGFGLTGAMMRRRRTPAVA